MNEEPRFPPLILASGSAPRRELLGRFGLPFEVVPADIDETPEHGESPEALVERLSREKARAVAAEHAVTATAGDTPHIAAGKRR